MRKKSVKSVMAASLAAAMMLTACGSQSGQNATTAGTTAGTAAGTSAEATEAKESEEAEEKITKDEIVVAYSVDIKSMDPQNQSDVASGMLINHIYNRLIKIHDDGTLTPELAESYEMVDDTTYHFKLKEGVKFHDGDELTAHDVKFTLERAKVSPSTTSSASHIEEVVINDDYDFDIKLTAPYPAITYVLGGMGMSIVSEDAVTAAGDNYGENPIGTGPFTLEEWAPNDHWTIKRFDDYFDGAPKASRIICRVIPEASSRCIALETGEADIALRISETDAPIVENNPDLTMFGEVGTAIEFMGINCDNEYFTDPRVRQAVNYAIDKQSIVDTILEGRGEVANTYVGKTIPGWDETIEEYPYDPEKAKELMAEAGYADGFSINMAVNGDVRTRTAQIIQAQLGDIGINVDITTYEFGAFLDLLQTGELDTYVLGWTNSTIDPDRSITPLFHSSQCGSNGNNYSFLRDESLDAEIEAAAIETDEETRMDMYKGIQAHLKELAPWVPLYYQQMLGGTRADLKGFVYDKNMSYYFGNCYYSE